MVMLVIMVMIMAMIVIAMLVIVVVVMLVTIGVLVRMAGFADADPHRHGTDQHHRHNGDAAPEDRGEPCLAERGLELWAKERQTVRNVPHNDHNAAQSAADADGAKLFEKIAAVVVIVNVSHGSISASAV